MDAVAIGLIGAVLMSAAAGPALRAQQPATAEAPSAAAEATRDATNGAAQGEALEKRISIVLVDEPIRRALATIAAQAGERFTYSSDDLPSATRVSLSQKDVSVGTALQLVLAGTSLHAVVMPDGAVVLTTDVVHPTPAALATGGTLVVTGRVIGPDGSPVRDATIGLIGTRDTTTAGDSGHFRISGIVPGMYILWARRVGFRASSMAITVGAPLSFETVTMMPTVASLPTVTTTEIRHGYRDVGFDQRMRAGAGDFLTYEQIVAQHAGRLTEVLQRLRGVTSGELPVGSNGTGDFDGQAPFGMRGADEVGGMWTQGSCVAVAVDGVAQGVLDNREIDNLVDPSDVGAIEVYGAAERPGSAGPGTSSDRMPLVLVGGRDLVPVHCTLVVIWTRQRLGIPSSDAPAADSGTSEHVPAPPDVPR